MRYATRALPQERLAYFALPAWQLRQVRVRVNVRSLWKAKAGYGT